MKVQHRPVPSTLFEATEGDRPDNIVGAHVVPNGRGRKTEQEAPGVTEGPGPFESSFTLIRLAKDGDQEALNRLLARYLPRLQRWASGRLPAYARGLTETQDLVQDALIGTVRNLESFTTRGEGALQAYLRHAVMNRVRDEIRRAVAQPRYRDLSVSIEDDGASPLELAMGRESFARYDAALANLDELSREAVIARVELGCSYQEIAELVDKPSPDAARMLVTRALAQVARDMARTGMA